LCIDLISFHISLSKHMHKSSNIKLWNIKFVFQTVNQISYIDSSQERHLRHARTPAIQNMHQFLARQCFSKMFNYYKLLRGTMEVVHAMWHYEAYKSTWKEGWGSWVWNQSPFALMLQPESFKCQSNFRQKRQSRVAVQLDLLVKVTYLLTVALREVNYEASNRRQGNQWPSTSMPQLWIDAFSFPCIQNQSECYHNHTNQTLIELKSIKHISHNQFSLSENAKYI
jgi:hypothetical protein